MTSCSHLTDWIVECDCGECLGCPVGSRAMMCGRCKDHLTMCEVCEDIYVFDADETVCLDCRAFAAQEYRNDNPQNWGFAYITKCGGW